MALDIETLADPRHTALVSSECQRGVAGDLSQIPDLAKAARDVFPNIASLCAAARSAEIPVIHCTAERREDGLGANQNARLFQYMAKAAVKLLPGSDAAQLVAEIEAEDSDLKLPRLHGLSPFEGTELDAVLRNQGITTLVCTGVSVNVAIQSLCFDAVNASYQVIVPRDAVAGFPRDYVEAVFEHTLGAVATLVSSADLLAVWRR